MGKVHILSDLVANQIAAGEVVERPAAVVKELLENSLDAGASQIELSIREGGRTSICVQDNGCGMAEDDALLCLERHATSKVRVVDDLLSLSSFGFRGEALPSIASVSRFSLQTRESSSAIGIEIGVDHGKFLYKKACNIPLGTRIEVQQLFQKLPVRLKFLKKDVTEALHIQQMIRLLALAHPEVSFKFIQDGKTLFHTPPCPNLAERISELLGPVYREDMLELSYASPGFYIFGFVSKAHLEGHLGRKEISFFINKRPVESSVLRQGLLEAYQGYIPPGRFPKAILFLELPPSVVDVNVHPTKREVRFKNDFSLKSDVTSTIRSFLETSSQDRLSSLTKGQGMQFDYIESGPDAVMEIQRFTRKPLGTSPLPPTVFPKNLYVNTLTPSRVASPSLNHPPPPFQPSEETFPWTFLNHLEGPYALFKNKEELIVFNSLLAAQRIQYEKLLAEFSSPPMTSQPLLLPLVLPLSPLQYATFQAHTRFLKDLGFDLEPFGSSEAKLSASPTWVEATQAPACLFDTLDLLDKESTLQKSKLDHPLLLKKLAKMAASRTAPPPSSPAHLLALAQALLKCEFPLICPRGLPTLFTLKWTDLHKKFSIKPLSTSPLAFS